MIKCANFCVFLPHTHCYQDGLCSYIHTWPLLFAEGCTSLFHKHIILGTPSYTYHVVQFLSDIILRIIFHEYQEALFALLASECVIVWKYCLQMCFVATGYNLACVISSTVCCLC